ncbi:Peptidylprolyl isomerase [Psidium guajava]|nr:Peptidylprolyl isomerase [Psidium guajava]
MHSSGDLDMDNPLRMLTIEHNWFNLVLYEVGWYVISSHHMRGFQAMRLQLLVSLIQDNTIDKINYN